MPWCTGSSFIFSSQAGMSRPGTVFLTLSIAYILPNRNWPASTFIKVQWHAGHIYEIDYNINNNGSA